MDTSVLLMNLLLVTIAEEIEFGTTVINGDGIDVTFRGSSVTKTFRWMERDNSWLNLHVLICGYFCDGKNRVHYNPVDGIDGLTCHSLCFPCDCKLTCSSRGTCCPNLHSSTPLTRRDMPANFYPENQTLSVFVGNISTLRFVNRNSNRGSLDEDFDPKAYPNGKGKPNSHCLAVFYNGPDVISSVHAIDACPDTETNLTRRRLCEQNEGEHPTLASSIPYSDVRNGFVFKNLFCLDCWKRMEDQQKGKRVEGHGESNTVDRTELYKRWSVWLKCKVYQSLYKHTSAETFFSAVLKSVRNNSGHKNNNPNCSLEYRKPKSSKPPRRCYTEGSHDPVTQKVKCLQKTSSHRVLKGLCHTIKSKAYRFHKRRNVFCYMCRDEFPKCPPSSGIGFSSDSLNNEHQTDLLTFYQTPQDKGIVLESPPVFGEYLCPHSLEWMDDRAKCQRPSCVPGKLLMVNHGTCKTAVSVIRGLGYTLSVVLVPDQKMSSQFAELVYEEVHSFCKTFMVDWFIGIYMVIFGKEKSEDDDVIQYVKIQGNFIAQGKLDRDDFERTLLYHTVQVKIDQGNGNETFRLAAAGFGVDFVSRMGISEYTQGNPEDQYHLPSPKKRVTRETDESSVSDQNNTRSMGGKQKIMLKNVLYVELGNPYHDHPAWELKDDFVDLNPSLSCPFVSFEIGDIAHVNDITLLITFHHRGNDRTFNTSEYGVDLSIEGQQLKVCIETFRENFQKMDLSNDTDSNHSEFSVSWMSHVKRHLTISCVIISVICLLLSSFTYCAFSQLRTLAGMNTLSLCVSLTFAHLSSVLVVELVGYVHGYVCVVIGIVTHYSWLCSFLWMCVSCAHMYSHFKASSNELSADLNLQEKHSQYCVATFGIAAVIVCSYICVCEILSGGVTTGYSDQICFLDVYWSVLTILISFIAPLVFVVITNSVLFAISSRGMVEVELGQSTDGLQDRDELVSYFRLSVLTCLQWFITCLAFQLENDFLDFVNALVIGLEGVFVFFSFTSNARTRELFKSVFAQSAKTTRPADSATTASQSTPL